PVPPHQDLKQGLVRSGEKRLDKVAVGPVGERFGGHPARKAAEEPAYGCGRHVSFSKTVAALIIVVPRDGKELSTIYGTWPGRGRIRRTSSASDSKLTEGGVR